MPALHNDDTFPTLAISAVGGGTISLPGDLAGSFGVVLITSDEIRLGRLGHYRGSWCPYCNMQLAGFARAADTLADLGIKLVAFSVDDEATAAALVAKHHLAFPVGYGADADKVAAATGAYTNDSPRYLQSAGFVLDPSGKVLTAVYSTGAIGRLVADDVVGLIRYVNSQKDRVVLEARA